MSSFIFVLGLFFLSPVWGAVTVTSQIHDVDLSANMSEETLVFLRNGTVIKVSKSDPEMAKLLLEKSNSLDWVELTIDENRRVLSAQSSELPGEETPREVMNPTSNYMPSVLGSMDYARRYFNESRYNSKESQCFNRAHVWTHDWRIKHNFYSMKAFIFFTKKYIRKYNFDWWFHVAPLVHVVANGKITERVMDIKYSRGPQKLRDWSNIFMKDDSACPIVTNYSDYADWPEGSHCYIMRTSMYYYQPLDLENLEKFGYQKNRWIEAELQGAYSEAFNLGI